VLDAPPIASGLAARLAPPVSTPGWDTLGVPADCPALLAAAWFVARGLAVALAVLDPRGSSLYRVVAYPAWGAAEYM
jgi:hypothetical protein